MVATDLAIRMSTLTGDQVTFDGYVQRIRRIRSSQSVDGPHVELLLDQAPIRWEAERAWA